jgi:hypothetical protein
MAVVCKVRHTTRGFSYNKDTKVLVGEASTVSAGDKHPLFGRVYDDAVDEGFILKSHKTGKEITFVVDKIDAKKGEIKSWSLVPIDRKTGRRDKSLNFKVLVFND